MMGGGLELGYDYGGTRLIRGLDPIHDLVFIKKRTLTLIRGRDHEKGTLTLIRGRVLTGSTEEIQELFIV